LRKILLLSLLLWVPSAYAQSVRYQSQVIGSRGTPLGNQNVAVCTQPANTGTQPCSPLATLATSTSTTSGGANPTTTDANGNFFFYAAPGRYTVQIYGPQVTIPFVQPDTVLACDPTGACSLSSVSITGTLAPASAGGADVGTAANPFGNLWLGTAATNNFKFQPAATAAARIISIPDPLGNTNLVLTPAAGTVRSSLEIADQGTACTNGELVLSAGWGTTATVTTVVGTGQTCEWTLTSSGTGQAANPTITDTLTNALPSANTVCEMRMVGGTGTATLIDQTTLSATAPVFTFNGTPVAASTYKVVRRCGP